jgi:hypothetical protein
MVASTLHKSKSDERLARRYTAAGSVKDVYAARAVLAKPTVRDGSITAAFERVGKAKDKVTFSHRQHSKTESR